MLIGYVLCVRVCTLMEWCIKKQLYLSVQELQRILIERIFLTFTVLSNNLHKIKYINNEVMKYLELILMMTVLLILPIMYII